MASPYLEPPFSEGEVRKFKAGDTVSITGLIYTARDQAHRRLVEYARQGRGGAPYPLEGSAIFHCGPIVRKDEKEGGWSVLAAGPTTSMRMELFQAEVIEEYGVRLIVGKAGMGARTADACRRFGAIVCDYTGGAALVAARQIKAVEGVEWLDLGMAEALWKLRVEGFGPLTVTIDAEGRNLHKEIEERARERARSETSRR